MLKNVRLKNFKLHEDTSIEASRITVFIGPNNSGKSSIFQALLALKQASAKGNNQSFTGVWSREETKADQPYLYSQIFGPIVDLGDFENVVRDPSRELEIGADVEFPPETLGGESGSSVLSFDFNFRDSLLARHRGSLACAYGRSQEWLWNVDQRGVSRVGFPISEGEKLILLPQGTLNNPFQASVESETGSIGLGASEKAREFGVAVQRLWPRFLESVHFVHQLRGFEEWGYPATAFPAHESLDRLVLSDRAVALTNLLAGNARLRTRISDLLKSLVGVGIEFETAPAHRLKVWATAAESGRPETLFVNEGSGANQLPFILVPLALAESGDTIILSEPEAHLHPRRQSDLMSMLLKIFKFAKAELQFFIETHSEHVLHRLLYAVAKGELANDDLTIYYFENKQGKAEARKLIIDEKGGVEGGLPGFFDQSLDELSEYLQALKEPKA